jgi:MFS family permease
MMTELAPKERRAFATAAAVAVNAVGLSLGPLFAGLLAQYVALPLRVPYALDLALLVPATLGMLAVPETVQPRSHKLRLRIQHMRVPEEIRGVFIRASIVGICGFAVTGVFSAVAPSILRQVLHEPAPALAGLLVCLILGTASIGQFAVHRIPDRFAFPAGCGLLLAGLGFLAVSIAAKSTALLFLSSVAAGVGWGIVVGFGLTQINTRVHERRGEVTSAYFVMLYAGLSFPVIGVGVAVAALGLSTAGILFSGIVGAVVLAVLLNSLSTTGELRESR